jgi:hypothetical protein
MRQFIFSLIVVMTMAVLPSCSQKKEPTGPVFPGAGVGQGLKEMLAKDNPDLIFGKVIAVRPNDFLAAVSGIESGKAKVGDVVVFYAGSQVVNVGKVVRIIDGDLHVLYETPSDTRRHVLVNDLAALTQQKN